MKLFRRTPEIPGGVVGGCSGCDIPALGPTRKNIKQASRDVNAHGAKRHPGKERFGGYIGLPPDQL